MFGEIWLLLEYASAVQEYNKKHLTLRELFKDTSKKIVGFILSKLSSITTGCINNRINSKFTKQIPKFKIQIQLPQTIIVYFLQKEKVV